jgi:hypothetical protein
MLRMFAAKVVIMVAEVTRSRRLAALARRLMPDRDRDRGQDVRWF